ncbi:MAG TPA: serine/threonine-protein kinase [Arthrobacter sp.]|nr:serine/threonine-protein kinase [Arthrobacter sp.]
MEDVHAPEVPGFAVERLLGQGGSALVWLATEHRSGRNFAVKCFRPGPGRGKGAEPVTEDAVRREIRILSALDHQHLVKAHDAVPLPGRPDGGTALVMDYAPGGSLAALVASRGRLTVGETVTVLTPLAQVLAYLHSQGFTHSDVSPGNVLFTGQGKPLLSDLGIARMLGDPGSAGHCGTPGFVDPAPVDAVRGLQPERDVYSTAALGWFCLTGQAPPRTADRPPLSLLIPGVPRELAAALEAGLNEDRRCRPTAGALATAIYRSASPQPLDLAASVHPTVIPELMTRLHVPAPSRSGAVKGKATAAGRRIATVTRGRLPLSRQPMPFPDTTVEVQPSHGKHARTAPGRGRRRKPVIRGMLPAAAALAACGLWWLSGSGGEPAGSVPARGPADAAAGAPPAAAGTEGGAGPAGAARHQAGASDPSQAVEGLARLRDLAFSGGYWELLDEVNAKGSPAAAMDQQTAEPLRSSGHILAGFSTNLAEPRTEDGTTTARAVVRVLSGSSAYEVKDSQGAVIGTGPAAGARQLRLVLVAEDGRWQISEILPGS